MRLTLQIKLALGVTGIVTVIMGLSAFWLTMNSRARLMDGYRDFAIGTTQVAEAGLENAMISRNPTEITSVIRSIDQREGADVSQIEQVLRNLVLNASEAIGEGSGTITIRTRRSLVGRAALAKAQYPPDAAEGDYAALDVVDTGHGMDKATRARIFDPFFSTKFTGRGLGLAAVLGIVPGHGGAIRVESEPGRGSTFTVLLPAAGPVDRAVVSEAPAS
jgi:signal transduction histidine kinase